MISVSNDSKAKAPLLEYAYMGKLSQTLEDLKSMAIPENWEYKDAKAPLPILHNYLNHTFARIREENKLLISDDYSCFNTGLVTVNQEEIIALFKKSGISGRISFEGFYSESDSRLFRFHQLPERATYFTDPSELIYDLRLDLRININHIVDDANNFSRFPVEIKGLPKHQLLNTFDGAIKHAQKRIKRNYKTAIPQYYRNSYIPDAPQLQLLLPLCLREPSVADLALAVYKIKVKDGEGYKEFYSGKTCLTLDWAINNARLIAKPDEEWLRP